MPKGRVMNREGKGEAKGEGGGPGVKREEKGMEE